MSLKFVAKNFTICSRNLQSNFFNKIYWLLIFIRLFINLSPCTVSPLKFDSGVLSLNIWTNVSRISFDDWNHIRIYAKLIILSTVFFSVTKIEIFKCLKLSFKFLRFFGSTPQRVWKSTENFSTETFRFYWGIFLFSIRKCFLSGFFSWSCENEENTTTITSNIFFLSLIHCLGMCRLYERTLRAFMSFLL